MRISKGRIERATTKYIMKRRKMSRRNPWYRPLFDAAKRLDQPFAPEVGQVMLDMCPRLVRKREKQGRIA
jgi:hypothetical protein